jgi:glucokinase
VRVAVGVDIGGTAIKMAAVTEEGSLSEQSCIETRAEDQPEAVIRRLVKALGPLMGSAARHGSGGGPVPVGMGCAGLITPESGTVRLSPNLPLWKDVPLGPEVAEALGAPTVVLNDANAFVLAEGLAGAGRGATHLLGLTLGTGVGGGILIGGRLHTGTHGFAGELGHTTVDMDGPPCPCGGRGCLEIFVGSKAIVRRYLELTGGKLGRSVADLIDDNRELLMPEVLFEGARRGDSEAAETFRITGEILGVGLANFGNSFNPDMIVIGGGVAQAGDLILEPARKMMQERMMFPRSYCPDVRPATLGPEAGVIGAAMKALDGAVIG